MNELVSVKGNEVLTNSLIIAEGVNRKHGSITKAIKRYDSHLSELGKVGLVVQPSESGQNQNVYYLNETQAVFLLTLMDNSPKVIEFKKRLAIEFVRMRRFILEKQSSEWQQARLTGKQVRREETDVILTKLIPLAESQGSKHPEKLYLNYSKLVNSVLGIEPGERDNLSMAYVDAIKFIENAIENIISQEVDKGVYYKEIYQVCKVKCQIIKELAFLPSLKQIGA
jgi:phage regulator Rha-like protein